MPNTSSRTSHTATVGIIVPAYNYGRYLDECLASVAAQSFGDFTVLVIDNASTDDTQAVAERWVARDARFQYLRNPTNLGLEGSLRKAYALLDNPLIQVLSADDYLAPTYLEHTAGALMRHPECVLAYSGWEVVFDCPGMPDHGQRTQYYIPNNHTGVIDDTAVLLTQNWITNSICLWRRDVCDVVGALNADGLSHVGDWYLYLRLMSEGPAYYVNDTLGFYRIHGDAESDRLRKEGVSAPDHVRIYDLIATSDRWPMSVRHLAKVHQIRWLTGEPLMTIARRMGSSAAHPIIRDMMANVRHDVLIGAARAVLEYTPGPNTLDTPANALAAIDDVLAEAPEHAGALALRARHAPSVDPADRSGNADRATGADFTRQCLCLDLAQNTPHRDITVLVDARAGGPLRRTLRSLKHQLLPATRIVLLGASPQLAEANCLHINTDALPAWQRAHCHTADHWMLGLIAGDTLADDALYHCVRRIESHPDARIVYTDHDEIGRDDITGNAAYKPDANAELLRSTPYPGRAILVRGDHLADHPAPLDLVASHALTLTALNAGGTGALAHVPALLMHLDVRRAITRPADADQGAALAELVHSHAARTAPGTTVIDGPGAGQFAWLPPLDHTPLVSIIIPTKDQLPLLSRCLDTLLADTRYPAFEVIVVDNDSETPEAREYLTALEAGRNPRVRVLRHPGAFNFSAMNNRAAEQAQGELLLLLNNDTEVIDPDWLGTMVRHALRDDVGVVGPALFFPDGRIQHAGVVLGMNGPADHPFAGEPGDAPGYLDRARLQQDYTAVTGACLLTDAVLYRQLGGLDETRFAVSYNDIDYCLRVREAGKRVVWTPLARLIHVSSASQLSGTEQLATGEKMTRFGKEREAMYQRWRTLIANDPAYNRNLSLKDTDCRPETEPLLCFDPVAAVCPHRVLALLDGGARGNRRRIIEPLAALKAAGLSSGGALHSPLDAHLVLHSGADTVLVPLPSSQGEIHRLQAVLTLPGIITVFDGDALLRAHPYIDASQADLLASLPEELIAFIGRCTRVIASNPRLAASLARLNADVRVVPDSLHPLLWGTAARSTPQSARRPRIAWIAEHAADSEVLAPVVEALSGEVEFICIGPCPAALQARVTCLDIADHPDYPAKLAALDWDIGLVPLANDARCTLRSGVRLLELGSRGRPVICTEASPHDTTLPISRVSNRPADWLGAIRALLTDTATRTTQGHALAKAIQAQQPTLPEYVERWRDAWLATSTAPMLVLPSATTPLTQALVDTLMRSSAPPESTNQPPKARTNAIASTTKSSPKNEADDSERETRARARQLAIAQGTPDAISATLNSDYSLLLERRVPEASDLQFLEGAMAHWPGTPSIHILTEARDSEFELLSNTLDSLGAQPYSLWSLSILASSACPDPAIAELPNIDWLHASNASARAKDAFDSAVTARACDVVVYLPPGTELDTLCLWRIAHEFATRPQCMALYTDDDVIRVDGNRVEPRFKPDISVDFLRSCDYIGPLWVRRSSYRQAGGFAENPSTRFYDLTLRVLDAVGKDAIGHVADPLLSLPVSPTLLISDQDAHVALRAHLARNGLEHDILHGALHATWRVDYHHIDTPRVDIVMSYQNWLEFVEPAVDSVFRLTRWPDFRLILVDNGSDDPDCADWAERIQATYGDRVLRTSLPGPWNRAAAFNHGAQLSDAPYVLFLHHDIQILTEHWLDRLMALVMRPDVAAAAPRQVRPGDNILDMTGTVFGLTPGIGSPETDDTPLNDPGYLARLKTDQNFNLLDSACLLTRRAHFDAVGGFDTDFGLRNGEIDLSARLATRGLLVWTPWVTIAHYGTDMPPIELPDEMECIISSAQFQAAVTTERIRLVDRYIGPLAKDGAWNQNLRLNHESVRLESGLTVPWRSIPADVPRLVADTVSGAGEFRAIAPLRVARKAGKAQGAIIHPPGKDARRLPNVIDLARLEGVSSYLVHNPALAEQITLLRQIRTHMPDLLVVALLDDLTTGVPHQSDVFAHWSRETRTHMRRCFAQCHRLVVSTEPLAEFARHMVDDIRVVPNRVEWSRWEGLTSKRRAGRKPRVGWAGALQHAGDLALVEEVVRLTSHEVEWVFFGMCPAALAPYVHESHSWVDFDHYPAKLASLNLDLAIAPLEINAFNESKSNLRLLDYGVLGWPVICTDIEPYKNAPVTRVNNSTQEWLDAIRAHIYDLDTAASAGDVLRQWVLDNYILEGHIDDWLTDHLP